MTKGKEAIKNIVTTISKQIEKEKDEGNPKILFTTHGTTRARLAELMTELDKDEVEYTLNTLLNMLILLGIEELHRAELVASLGIDTVHTIEKKSAQGQDIDTIINNLYNEPKEKFDPMFG